MLCKRCGAELRETDRFCSQCGAPAEIQEKAPVNLNMEQPGRYDGAPGMELRQRREQETYYDENLYRDDRKLYRDSFLDKKEEKSHALLTTVTVLLVIAVLAAAFLVLFFFMKKSGNGSGSQNDIQIVSDGSVTRDPNSLQDGDEDIIIITEPSAQTGPETEGGGTAPETEAGQMTEPPAAPETEAGTEPVTEAALAVDIGRIEEILNGESTVTKAAVYVYDLQKYKEYTSGSCGDPMYASALISVPILYTAAVRLDRGEITLNDQITYVNSIGGRGEAYPEERDGQSFPLSYYLTTMLSYSDNNCMNCLIDYLGLDTINSICRESGYSSVDIQRKIVDVVTDGKDNYVSAADLAGMVRELYQGKYAAIGRDFMVNYFRIDEGDGYRTVIGLASDIPAGTLFLNQNGKGDTRYNEVALVSDDTRRYIICVMCNGDYGFQYETAVEDISNYIYQCLG